MKNCLKLSIFLLMITLVLSFTTTTYAQSKGKTTDVKMTVEEIFYMVNLLQRVEISGNEVTPFLSIFDRLKGKTKVAVKQKMKAGDRMSIKFNATELRNFLLFMQRTKIVGGQAAKFKGVAEKIIKGIKKLS